MNRSEHLQWCKDRALEYVENDDTTNAIASMQSDMGKHEELADHLGLELGMKLLLMGHLSTTYQIREWVIGFN